MRDSKKRIALLNVKQAAQLLNVKESTVYSWVYQRYIPFIKLGRLIRFDPEKIMDWVKSNSNEGRKSYTPDVDLSKLV